MGQGSTIYLLTAICILQLLGFAANEPIVEVDPKSQIAKPNDMVVFWCQGKGENAQVRINESVIGDYNPIKGFDITEKIIGGNTHNVTITVQSVSAEINNTKLRCEFDDLGEPIPSGTAILIVAGPPLAPSLDVTVLNHTSLQVSWNEPFTWPGFEIESYSLLIRYTSSGNESKIQDINANWHSYILTRDSAAEECEDIEFFLTATSDVGESSPQVAFGGFPKNETSVLVETDVSFQKDGNPQVDIWLKLKNTCSYITYNYTLSIKNDSETIFLEVEHLRSDLVYARLRNSLKLAEKYEAFARVDSLVDSSNNLSLFTTESEWFTVPTEKAEQETKATGSERLTVPTEKAEQETKATEKEEVSKLNEKEEEGEACQCEQEGTQTNASSQTCDLNMWIVGGAGAAFVMLLVATCLILCFVAYKRKQHYHDAEKIPPTNTKPMQNNPIYEGAIYETLDGVKPLDELKTESTPNGSIKNCPLPQLPKEGNTDIENMKDVNQIPDTYMAMEKFIPLKEEEIDANLNVPLSDTTSVRSKQLSPSNTYVTMHSAVASEKQDN